MRSFLRDMAFMGLFGAAVAAIVLIVAMHQGRFSSGLPQTSPEVTSPEVTPPTAPRPHARQSAAVPAPQVAPKRSTTTPGPNSQPKYAFDPATRGVLGDARVLCLPEISWLQERLTRWSVPNDRPAPTPPATLEAAHAAARRASAFDYQVSPECWNEPGMIETRGWGDCADKSLWLARELLHAGYTMVGIRLGVSEDYEPGQPGHAWVVLYHNGSEWIYDPAASPRLTSQDAGPTKRFRITATVFPRQPAPR